MSPVQCKNCGTAFDPKWIRQKFCCQSCSAIYNNKRRVVSDDQKMKVRTALLGRERPALRTRKPKPCQECGLEFLPDRPRRRFCSHDCWLKARGASDRKQISYRTFRKIIKRAFPDWKCPFCDWKATYDVHHINGRSSNDISDLVMICPNHHSAVHHGLMSKDKLIPFAVGKMFTWQQLLDRFYGGQNAVVNHTRYRTEKSKNDAHQRSHTTVTSIAALTDRSGEV